MRVNAPSQININYTNDIADKRDRWIEFRSMLLAKPEDECLDRSGLLGRIEARITAYNILLDRIHGGSDPQIEYIQFATTYS